MAVIELADGMKAIVDDIDYEDVKTVGFPSGLSWTGRICDMTWRLKRRAHTFYAVTTLSAHFELCLHRAVMSAKLGQVIDHINGDGLNNTRENLRVATHAENARNKSKSKTQNASQYKGVSPFGVKFHARIKHNRKKIHLGTFTDEIEAAKAYDTRARELFGEFAKTNFPS